MTVADPGAVASLSEDVALNVIFEASRRSVIICVFIYNVGTI